MTGTNKTAKDFNPEPSAGLAIDRNQASKLSGDFWNVVENLKEGNIIYVILPFQKVNDNHGHVDILVVLMHA